jgi:hypothetical protein
MSYAALFSLQHKYTSGLHAEDLLCCFIAGNQSFHFSLFQQGRCGNGAASSVAFSRSANHGGLSWPARIIPTTLLYSDQRLPCLACTCLYMLGPDDTLSPRWYLFSPSPPLISPPPPASRPATRKRQHALLIFSQSLCHVRFFRVRARHCLRCPCNVRSRPGPYFRAV